MAPSSIHSKKRKKHLRWTWRKPPGKPKRPLSAYNLFFADVRRELLNERFSHGAPQHGLGFSNLARTVAARWRVIDPDRKHEYELQAETEHEHYTLELSRWKLKHASPEPEAVRSCRSCTTRKTHTNNWPGKAPGTTQTASALEYAASLPKPDQHESMDLQEYSKRYHDGGCGACRPARRHSHFLRSPFIATTVRIKQEEKSPTSVMAQDSSLFALLSRKPLHRDTPGSVDDDLVKSAHMPLLPTLDDSLGRLEEIESIRPLVTTSQEEILLTKDGDGDVTSLDDQPQRTTTRAIDHLKVQQQNSTSLSTRSKVPPSCSLLDDSQELDMPPLVVSQSSDTAAEVPVDKASRATSPIPMDEDLIAEPPASFLMRVMDEEGRQMLLESFPLPSRIAEV